MATNLIATFAVSLVEDLASSVLQHYATKSNGRAKSQSLTNVSYNEDVKSSEETSLLIGSSECTNTLKDFETHDPNDVVFEEFDSTDNDLDVFSHTSTCNDGTDNKESNVSGAMFAWRHNRPKLLSWLWSCFCCTFGMLTAGGLVVASAATFLVFLDINSADLCVKFDSKWYSMPLRIQQIRIVSQMVEGWCLQLLHFSTMLMVFKWPLIREINLLSWNLSAAFLDSCYRAVLHIFRLYYKDKVIYPLNMLYVVMMYFNSYKIAKHFYSLSRRRFALMFQLGSQFIIGTVVVYLTVYLVIPWFTSLSSLGQALAAAGFPIFGAIAKAIARLSTQHIQGVNHPGTSYVLVLAAYTCSAFMYRVMQAELQEFNYFVVISVVHGFMGLLERVTVVIRDYVYSKAMKTCCRRRKKVSGLRSFRTPRTQRLHADIIISGIIIEMTTLFLTNGFVHIYAYQYGITLSGHRYEAKDVILNFVYRCGVGFGVEFLFCVLSIFILTWNLNIPLLRVWKLKWKSLVLCNLFVCCILVLYTTEYLLVVVDAKYRMPLIALNETNIIQRMTNCTTNDRRLF